jgi:hypothetical protein
MKQRIFKMQKLLTPINNLGASAETLILNIRSKVSKFFVEYVSRVAYAPLLAVLFALPLVISPGSFAVS